MTRPTYEELEAMVRELTRTQERAVHTLDCMWKGGRLNFPELRQAIKGDAR